MENKLITKEEFLTAYNNHLPSKWIEFGFKYFSQSTKPKDAKVKKTTKIVLVILFILMMIGNFANIPMSFMIYPIIIYAVTIFGLVGFMIAVNIFNNRRIKKIVKELDILIQEYQQWVNMYIK